MSPPEEVQRRLLALWDPDYRRFYCGLIPTVDPETVLGVRVPDLRQLAGELSGTDCAGTFLRALPHRYYEENNLHGLLIGQLRDWEETISELEIFLPYVDNWATCDLIRPRAFRGCPAGLPGTIRRWMDSAHPFTVRFGMEMLMVHCLGAAFRPEYPAWVAAVPEGDYYVEMMAAWYFATALSCRWEESIPYLSEGRLSAGVHNKAIQKAVESRRITPEQKDFLRGLRRKEDRRGVSERR